MWLHLCSRKSICSPWYRLIEFTTSVLDFSCLYFCYWNNYKKKITGFTETTKAKSVCFMMLEEKGWFWGFHFVNGWGPHWNELWHIHDYINIAKYKRQRYLHTSVCQLWTRNPFTLKLHSSFQMIPLNVWLIFIQLLYLEHLKDPWAIYFF